MSDAKATPEDVQRLARLARIEVPEASLGTFAAEFDAVLAYVGRLDALDTEAGERPLPAVRNRFREDGTPTPPGAWTERLSRAFPERDGDSLSVKRIISHD
jgi:aspartyl-tRNA(Asn)/glutamyl-tRNA(Gln) amidotransferase subunit C